MRVWIPVAVIALAVLVAIVGALTKTDTLVQMGTFIAGGGLGALVPRKSSNTGWLEAQASAARAKAKERETPTVPTPVR